MNDQAARSPMPSGGTARRCRPRLPVPATWRRLPRDLWVLLVARAVNRLGAFTLPFLSVLLTQQWGASVAQAGYVLAAFGLATLPSRLLGGWLADRLSRRTTIAAGLGACAMGQLLVAASSTLAEATGAAVLLGLAFEIYEAPSQALVADLVDAPDRPAAFGMLTAALAIAGMGAGLVAVVVGQVDLRLLFVVDAVSCLVCAVLVRLCLPSGAVRVADDDAARVRAWRDPLLVALLVTGTAFACLYMQLMVTLPLTLVDRGLQAHQFGLLLTVSAATVVAGQPLLGLRWLRRGEPTAALVGGYLLVGAGLSGYALVESLPGFMVMTAVWSLGDLILLGRAMALVADIAPAAARGRYLAVYGLSWGVASVAAPVAGATTLTHLGAPALWSACGVVCGGLALAQLALRPLLVRRIGAPGAEGTTRDATCPRGA